MPEKKFSSRFAFTSVALAAVLLSSSSCASRKAAAHVPLARAGTIEEGIASWYGDPYHGRRAANGEIFDMDKMTAAHPSLPFESWVRVRHLNNGKETEVRITDRGPFVKGRIIDLSRAAAKSIDMFRQGTAKVRVTVIEPPGSYLRGKEFTVQVSSLRDKARAERLLGVLRRDYKEVAVRHRKANPPGGHPESWRVLVGREKDFRRAGELLLRLSGQYPNAFLIPWDAE